MNKRTPLVLLVVAAALVVGTMLYSPIASIGVEDTVTYKGRICACVNSDGVCYEGMPGVECSYNTLTSGKEAIEDYITGVAGSTQGFVYLALSNSSADYPTDGDTNFTVELTGGLARAQANLEDHGTGNWSLVYTWTADGSFMSVNTTGIFNSSNAGEPWYFAGGTFTSVNLESSDTLTINYSLWVS